MTTQLVAPDRTPVATRWRWVAAVATSAAAGLHVVAAVQHTGAPVLAAGLLAAGAAQLALGLYLGIGSRGSGWDHRVVTTALAGTVVLVLAFLVAHTTPWLAGLPGAVGDHVGHGTGHATVTAGPVSLGLTPPAEVPAVDALGTATVALELLTVLGLAALLPDRWRSRATTAMLALGLAVWAAWWLGLLG
ncbi:MAG: hypothetical protein JWQ53_18 [Klenkia sp.]|nr:hypothetical protein [Klenkia sp.]